MRLRLFVPLSASLLVLLFGCGKASNTDPGPEQLMKLINDYRVTAGHSPWTYAGDVAAVAQAYAHWLDNHGPTQHQFPYSENADGKGRSGRLTDAGIATSAAEEVGRSDAATSNAQLFFTNYVVPSGILTRDDIDEMGVGHVSPTGSSITAYHYWILDVIKRVTP